jgi:hypothetical protein
MTTFPFKKADNITSVQFDQVIEFTSDVEYFTNIEEINPIPSNTIIHKTITGLGATHSEIVAERHSIIVLPYVSIIMNKQKEVKYKNITFAIHADVSVFEVAEYLMGDNEYAKILTTPKGLDKVIKALKWIKHYYPESNVDCYRDFFLLIDECQKLIQDSNYRNDMLDLMDHFFAFDNKAMISATVIPPSDHRFMKQNFRNVKVTPNFKCEFNRDLYIPEVNLVHSNSLINGVQKYLDENQSEHHCIFFNSVEGIKSLISQSEIKNDYQIFCSKESKDILKLASEPNAKSEIGELKKFNFFTKSFFNGLDIILDYKPNVLIITDVSYRTHTMLDPYTDVLQIIGRFRKKKDRSNGYRTVTHINVNTKHMKPVSEEEAIIKVEDSQRIYEALDDLRHAHGFNDLRSGITQMMSTGNPYFKLLHNDEFSTYLFDNYLDSKRVKNYYVSEHALYSAYINTGLYKVSNDRDLYRRNQIIQFKTQILRYTKEMNKLMADALLDLEDYRMLDIYYKQQFKLEKLSFLICDAFYRLGYDTIKALGFNKKKIDTELQKLDVTTGRNSFPVITMAHSTFHLNKVYSWKYVKETLQRLFDEVNIKYVAKSTDIEKYFEVKICKRKDERCYIFTDYKQLPVVKTKHI